MILVVDDNPNIVKLITFKLNKEGYHFRTALTGKDALNLINVDKPDLVILDVVLPDMIGFDLCHKITSEPKNSSISVIMLSVKDSLEDKYKGLKAGAVDYITKPFNPDELLLRIKRILETKQLLEKWNDQLSELQKTYTELKEKYNEEIEKERISAINEIAISINHEINNPLCTIIGNAELLLRELESANTRVKSKLKSIINESLRIQEVTWKMANIIKPLSVDYYRNLKMVDIRKSQIKDIKGKK